MAGYTRTPKTYRLSFSDPQYAGLEIRMRGMSTGALIDFEELREEAGREAEVIAIFAGHILDWNLQEEDETPIPVSLEEVRNCDYEFTIACINAWTSAMAGVAAPLPESSPAGEPSPAVPIPMAPLSGSQAS